MFVKKTKTHWPFVAAFSVVACVPAQAQNAERISEGARLARTVLIPGDLEAVDQREEIVASYGRYCGALKEVYPTNSPDENEWVFGEIAAGDKRALRALSSKEWGRVEASRFTTNCEMAVQLYLGDASARPQAVFVLIEAIANFAGDAEFHAIRNDINPTDWAFSTLMGSGIRTLAAIGVRESNLLIDGTDVVRNVGEAPLK